MIKKYAIKMYSIMSKWSFFFSVNSSIASNIYIIFIISSDENKNETPLILGSMHKFIQNNKFTHNRGRPQTLEIISIVDPRTFSSNGAISDLFIEYLANDSHEQRYWLEGLFWKNVFNKTNTFNPSNWSFTRGYWLSISEHYNFSDTENIFILLWNQGYFIITFFFIFYIFSIVKLVSSTNIQKIISSFFTYIIVASTFIAYITSEYVAIVIIIVYAGAVIIFFIFILFTMDPFHFSIDADRTPVKNAFTKKYKKEFKVWFYSIIFFNISIFVIKGNNFSFHKPSNNSVFELWWKEIFSQINGVSNPVISYGNLLFSDYWVATSALAAILLFVLIASINLLTFSKNKKNPNFWKLFFLKWHNRYLGGISLYLYRFFQLSYFL